MTLLYMKTNLVSLVSLPNNTYVSSEDTVYTVDKLYNKRPSYPFRFSGVDAQWIKVGFVAAQEITAMAIFNHNLIDEVATISLKAGDDGANYWLKSTPDWREENLYSTFGDSYKWWQLDIDNGADTPVQIGEPVSYTHLTLPTTPYV